MPSLMSRAVEWMLPLTGLKHSFSSEANLRRAVARNRMRGPALPSWLMRRRLVVEERHEGQCRIFTLHPPKKYTAGLHILYLHGGAFTFAITAPQWRFIVRIIRRLGCSVTVPLYPLAPEHTCPEVFEFLLPLASELLRENRRTVFMGDSAGGGIALVMPTIARR
jgi:acetyl esterase/lipase